MTNLLPKDGSLIYIENFLTEDKADLLFKILIKKVKWEQKEITLYEKTHLVPRLTAWFGISNYSYSGIENVSQERLSELLVLKKYIEDITQIEFNSCLLNLYRDGKDHVTWHADNEKELGKNPVIASFSLGEPRKFQLKHKVDKDLKLEIEAKSGSLILMSGEMQNYWLHRIAPTTKEKSERINITFRQIK
jgi:alkylated DNA repair dioxygenase AlkB